jgi:aspartate aminotransferase
MKISNRLNSINPSMTLAIDAKAKELKAQGVDVIGFGTGEPDFPTPENVKEAAIKAIRNNQTKYPPVPGTDELKNAIIQKFQNENGVTYSSDQILVSTGAKQSFYNLAQTLWEPGDEIIVPAPYWVSYPDMILLSGATPKIVETTISNGFKLTPDQLKDAVSKKTKAIVINSPSNPTGSAYSKKELEALVECALKNNLLIVSDEIYERIVFDGFEQVSVASLGEEVKKHSIIINGTSKAFSMTGWRIGYMVAEPEIIKSAKKLQGQITSGACSISQAAAAEALTGPQDYIPERVQEFQKRRDFVLKALESINGVNCFKPVGTFYCFPDFSGILGASFNGKKIENSLDLGEFLLEEAKVALVPGSAFGAKANMRFSYATSMQILEEGLSRIKNTFEKLN